MGKTRFILDGTPEEVASYPTAAGRPEGVAMGDAKPERGSSLGRVDFGKAVLLALAVAVSSAGESAPLPVVDDFANPPASARPHVWWHWMGNNVTREGIAADIREMREAGIGGATIFTIATHSGTWMGSFSKPANAKMSYRNEEWWDLIRFAAAEARRNGLEIGIHNSPGFTHTGGPWIRPEHAMKKVGMSSITVEDGSARMPKPPTGRFGYYRDIALVAQPVGEKDVSKMKVFEPPFDGYKGGLGPGKWCVRRFGMVCTGRRPLPAPEDVQDKCLEVDKLSVAAMQVHVRHAIRELHEKVGGALDFVMVDSYEAGNCNWTDDMREQFAKRRGYDPLPWLVALQDKSIAGGARFKEDLALTVRELFVERCFRSIAEACHEAGYGFHAEPYDGPFDSGEVSTCLDVPMVEFWGFRPVWRTDPGVGGYGKATAAVGRALGRRVFATEAYTGMPADAKWIAAPRHFKACTDATFARGINRMVLHHWVHQPFDRRWKPGMTMGWWGTHFGSCQTWYEPGKAFFRYLTRCQALFQRGAYVVDVLAVAESPMALEFDVIPTSLFLTDITVEKDGSVSLPSGRRYRLLRLPPFEAFELPVLERVLELARKGANIRLAALPTRTHGDPLGKSANRVAAIAGELGDHAAKKGNVTIGSTDAEVLARLGVPPPVAVSGGKAVMDFEAAALREDGNDLFFVANLTEKPSDLSVRMRTDKASAEVWQPATGRRFRMGNAVREKSVVCAELHLEPQESVFVVFRPEGAEAALPVFSARKVARAQTIEGPWTVTFPANQPFAPRKPETLTNLVSLSESSDSLVRHFSGTANYVATFDWNGPVEGETELDLGDVREIAEVTLNGKCLGVSWFAPFRVRTTGALCAGRNTLEIKVTNTWANRIIGDEQEPDDCLWNKTAPKGGRHGVGLLETPDFVLGNGQRPSAKRATFSFWRYYAKSAGLLPSGLLGPVRIDVMDVENERMKW